MRALLALAFSLVVGVTPASAESPSPGSQSPDPDALYVQSIHILGGNANVVSRWAEPIHFAVVDGGRDTPARRIVTEAAGIAGIEVDFPADEHSAPRDVAGYESLIATTPPYALGPPCPGNGAFSCVNFLVVLATNDEMQRLAAALPLPVEYGALLRQDPNLYCMFAPYRTGRRQIRQVVVYLRNDLDEAMLETCLYEEIYQAFGLLNDYTGSTIFSFNNVVAPKQITAYDKLLLASLYDPSVKPGYPVNMVASIFMAKTGNPLR